MSQRVEYNSLAAALMVPRWTTQASQLRTTTSNLDAASTGGLPESARGAATRFLDLWQGITRRASVAADVYADELRATDTSYADIDAEIARRMALLRGGPQ